MGILGNIFSGDNLYRIGAALKDIGDDSSENLTAAEKMLAGRAAQQRKAQGLAQLQQILAGQTQPLNAGNPSVESMVAGQMTGAEGAPSLAQVTARPMPKMPSLRDGRTPAQLLALAASNPDEVGLAMKMMEANAPHVKVGPDGTTYDEGDPGVLDRTFANRANVNGAIIDLNDAKNTNRYIPKMDDGAVPLYDAAGNIVAQRLLDGTIQNRAALAGAETGAKAAGAAPYEFINVPTATGAPQTMAKSQAVGGVFTGQAPSAASAAKIQGDAAAAARVGLPQAISNSDLTLGVIEKLKAHPALASRTGALGLIPAIPGTPGVSFDALRDQLKGKLFMEAYAGLRGGGQITEVEGRKATDAMATLNAAQTTEDFVAALDDLKQVIAAGKERAAAQAGAQNASHASAPAAPPEQGAVIKGYRYIGGDPSSPRSWQRAQ